MSEATLDPPFVIEVDGKTEHENILDKERALRMASDLFGRDPTKKVEVFDCHRERVYWSEPLSY